jgi:hypothetical protein
MTFGGAVNTVAAVATVAKPGTPPFPRPNRREMAINVGSCWAVACWTYSSIFGMLLLRREELRPLQLRNIPYSFDKFLQRLESKSVIARRSVSK